MIRIPKNNVAKWSRTTVERFARLALGAELTSPATGVEDPTAARLYYHTKNAARAELVDWALRGLDMARAQNYEEECDKNEIDYDDR